MRLGAQLTFQSLLGMYSVDRDIELSDRDVEDVTRNLFADDLTSRLDENAQRRLAGKCVIP